VENFFGNYIENVVKSFASNDGVKVPAPIRICLDIIETKGIESEHLYRRNINKSQLESICDLINHNRIETRIDELNADPNLCGAIVKKFLRELKAPLINDDMLNTLDKFDAGISDKDAETKIEFLRKLISKMPQSNYELVAYLVMHFHKILNKVCELFFVSNNLFFKVFLFFSRVMLTKLKWVYLCKNFSPCLE
jgi:RalA-binding protein 1